MINKLNKVFHTPAWLFVLMLIVLVFRIPTLLEPYAYGDEMIYLSLGEAIRKNVTLYSEIHDNKPPLLYILAALGGSLFYFRAILAIWHMVTVYAFWKLTSFSFPEKKKYDLNEKIQIIATCVFAIATTLPLLEGNIANAEMFMIGFSIIAFYLLVSKKTNYKNIFAAGTLFSLAALFKIPAAFEIPAIVIYWLSYDKTNRQNIIKIAKKTAILAIGFLFPIVVTFIYYYLKGALPEYFVAAFGQNVGYLSSFRPGDIQEPFLTRNAPLLLRGFIVAISILIIFLSRKKVTKQFLFYSTWLILTVFAVTLSERPYPHYLIQSMPPFAVLIAMLIKKNTREQVLTILPLTVFFAAPVYFNFWRYPVLPYYQRFYKFATKQISKEEYYSSFGPNVVVDYKISNFINDSAKPDDTIFVWGDNGTIYALTRKLPPIKYVADYHISDFSSQKEVVQQLRNDLPDFVVVLPGASPFYELDSLLFSNYGLTMEINNARIYKLLSPQIRYLISPDS